MQYWSIFFSPPISAFRCLLLLLSQFSFLGLDPLRHVLLEVLFSRLDSSAIQRDTTPTTRGTDSAQLNMFGYQKQHLFSILLFFLSSIFGLKTSCLEIPMDPPPVCHVPPHPPALACTLDCEHSLPIRDLTIQTTLGTPVDSLPHRSLESAWDFVVSESVLIESHRSW